MSRRAWLLIVATIPLFVFANVYQTFRFQGVQHVVSSLESREQSWLESNKRVIAGIAVLRAPARIDEIASDKLDLKQSFSDPVLRIHVPDGGTGNHG